MKTLLIALISILLSVGAQFMLKEGMSGDGSRLAMAQAPRAYGLMALLGNKYVLGGFLLYGLGALVWLKVLTEWDVSKAYPLVGAGFVMAVAVGQMRGEIVSPMRFAGVLLICAGVAIVSRT